MSQTSMFGGDMKPSFHNTERLEGEELREKEVTAGTQDDLVLDVFKRHSQSAFTVYMIWEMLGQSMLKSSVGRAVSNLTERGLLIKTSEQKLERYGHKNYLYKLNPKT